MQSPARLAALWISIMLLVSGCTGTQSSIKVEDVWARPGLAGGNSAVYFTIENTLNEEDRLLDVKSGIGELVELHQSLMDSEGNMTMEHQESVTVPAGSLLVFMPGSLHVMITNLHQDLQENDTFTFTLFFEKAGAVEVQAVVKQP